MMPPTHMMGVETMKYLAQGNGEHECTGAPDEIGIAAGDSLVNDFGIEAGEVQRGNSGRQLEYQDGHYLRQIRLGVAPYKGDKHAHGSLRRVRE